MFLKSQMQPRHSLLRALFAMPRFRGRDRMIGAISGTFVARPERLPDGLMMQLDVAEWAQLEILVNGATEPATLRLIKRIVASGDCVIDVGAHVGHHALCAAQAAGHSGRVFALDPQPYNADRISRNAALNGLANLVVVCAAAGERDGFIKLPIQSDRDRSRLSLREPGPNDLSCLIEVPIRQLDTFMAAHGVPVPKLLKIDVEGYEYEVLQGLGTHLVECPNLIFELLPASGQERNQQLLNLVESAGFALQTIEGEPWRLGEPLPEQNIWAARY